MVTMKNIRDVVLQEIDSRFNPYQVQQCEDFGNPSIEIMSKPGFPVISIDFNTEVEVYRTSEPDDVKTLAIEDPKFIDQLGDALDYFCVPR